MQCVGVPSNKITSRCVIIFNVILSCNTGSCPHSYLLIFCSTPRIHSWLCDLPERGPCVVWGKWGAGCGSYVWNYYGPDYSARGFSCILHRTWLLFSCVACQQGWFRAFFLYFVNFPILLPPPSRAQINAIPFPCLALEALSSTRCIRIFVSWEFALFCTLN